ncbi:class I SAM-dependent methyltransferase [Wenzhouxiangella limi]|uniref:Class I SAM-dependent methyltransferase n=1 Tax=Wenzhouxiangella limi TaxID=2707351 RepID=A0A845V006_9GAMM|nr:class I SAM-dependent methyltransferase [Wenzhouxiangella limi]NDY96378.1 class I SAM-dependent methyltransferase [Wenzhouxiangella limi]
MGTAESIQPLLRRAATLESEQPDQAGALYAQALVQDPACLTAHNALERLGHRQRFSHWMRINCRIHPDDDIFAFIARSPESTNPIRDYLADGWRTLSELMLLLEALDQPLLKTESLLEFACGFGRFTRHLAPVLPGRVTCADVLPGSVDFVREQFGVAAFESAMAPERLRVPGRYDLVFVLSLFTHLPVSAWRTWLQTLAGAVKPGGLLLLSFHNEQAAAEFGVSFDDSGIFFQPSSESPTLDAQRYGTTLTTRKVIEDEIAAALDTPIALYRERAFWVGQDAVAIRIGDSS